MTNGGRQVTGRVHRVNVSRGGVPKLPIESTYVRCLGLEGDGHNEAGAGEGAAAHGRVGSADPDDRG